MSKDMKEAPGSPSDGLGLSLEDLLRQGARQIIHQVIEAELAELLSVYANVKTLEGRQAVVRNGYLPGREILTAAGPVGVQVPKVRDRSGSGVKFTRPWCRRMCGVRRGYRRPCLGCT